jgi:hypothetical protein
MEYIIRLINSSTYGNRDDHNRAQPSIPGADMHASKHLQLQISDLKHAHLQHLRLLSSSKPDAGAHP